MPKLPELEMTFLIKIILKAKIIFIVYLVMLY